MNLNIKSVVKTSIPVELLVQCPLHFEIMTESVGLQNLVSDKNLHRPQLALAGFVELFTFHRIQIFGNTEMYYLKSLTDRERSQAFERICQFSIPCIILTNNHELEDSLLAIAKNAGISILKTPDETTKTIFMLSEFLDDQFSEQCVVHGSFVDVYGVGVLLHGRSGIGKSEIALDLIERGHRLVADDVVMFTKKRESILIGTGTSLVKHFMEIRGLGIIDLEKMFGIRAIRFQKRLEIIVELEEWDKDREYERTGLDESKTKVLDINIDTVKLPIFAGKNITVITEVIALNYLLKTYGYNAPHIFAQKLRDEMQKKRDSAGTYDQRLVNYFQSDDE